MKNIEKRITLTRLSILTILLLFAHLVHAEGTKQLAPNTISLNSGARDTVALLNINGFGNGCGYPGATDKNRIYFNICDINERVAIGLGRYYYGIPTSTAATKNKLYYKIYNAAGVLVKLDSIGNGARAENLPTYSKVLNGPNISGIGTGYDTTGYIFTPTSIGEHYIVFMDHKTDVSQANLPTYFYISHFDLTVFKKNGNKGIEYPGRLFSKAWALRTEAFGYPSSTGIVNSYQRPFAGKIYVLGAKNNFVTSVDFKGSGFRGLGFVLAFNETGLYNTGNVGADRRSKENVEAVNPQYKVFLNLPDQMCYPPNLNLPHIVSGPVLTYAGACGDLTNLCIKVVVQGQGTLSIFLDYHGNDGVYTVNTEDVLFNLNLGTSQTSFDTICIPYNGQNGLGVMQTVAQIEAVDIKATFSSGVTHFTMYDVEYLSVGYLVKAEVPSLYTSVMRYNDTLIPDLSGTGQPKFQINGALQPTHSWTNFNYGDQNTINSWWEAYSSTSVVLTNNLDVSNVTPDIYAVNNILVTPNDNAQIEVPQNGIQSVCLDVNDPNPTDIIFYYHNILQHPLNGTLTVDYVNNDSCSVYTPNPGYIGYDTVIVRTCDNAPCQLCDSVVLVFHVVAPTIILDTLTLGDSIVTCVDGSGLPGSIFTLSLCNPADSSLVTIISGNCIEYEPVVMGLDTICVTICDEFGFCEGVIIIYNVLNDKPVAVNDTVSTFEETPIIINVGANDFDLANAVDLTTVNVYTNPINGIFVVNPVTGAITYTPNLNYIGLDSLYYEICDLGMPVLCDSALVLINVLPVNDPPIALNDTVVTPEDTPIVINILNNDNDTADQGVVNPGSVVIIASGGNGFISVDPITGDITYTPNLNFFGNDSIVYVVCDFGYPTPAMCDTATVYITVSPVNDPPVANDDYAALNPFSTITFPILVNDYDVETSNSNLVITLCSTGNLGAIVTIVGDSMQYTMPFAQSATTDTVCYFICDEGMPILCDTAYVYVTLPLTNLAPNTANDYVQVDEDSSVIVFPLLNSVDPNLDSIFVSVVSQGTYGSAVLNPDGSVTYTPNPNYNGMDTLYYTVCDTVTPPLCSDAIIVITVNPINDAPIANPDYVTLLENSFILFDPLVNDNDTADNLALDSSSVFITLNPSFGTAFVNPVTGQITYTPNNLYNGMDTLIYMVCDKGYPLPRLCDTAIVIITVLPVNSSPVVVNDSVILYEDSLIIFDVLFNDNDNNDGLPLDSTSVVIISGPFHGTATVDPVTGAITYIPDPNYNGLDSLAYVVCDLGNPLPALCDTAYVIITVLPVNDQPVANTDYVSTNENTPVLINPLANDNDFIDNGLMDSTSVLILVHPVNGVITLNPITGEIEYTPLPGFTGLDSLVYEVCDLGIPMPELCDTATIYITVIDVPNIDTVYVTTYTGTEIIYCLDTLDGIVNVEVVTDCFGLTSGTGDNTSLNYTLDNQGCITLNTFNSIIGNDTLCVVICDSNLVCDTTIVIVTVLTNAPPSISCNDTIIYLDINGQFTIDTSFVVSTVFDDNLDSVWLSQTTFDCSNLTGATIVTVYAMDSLGLMDSCFANVITLDTISPYIQCLNSIDTLVSVDCGFDLPDYTAQAIYGDNCDPGNIMSAQSPLPGTQFTGEQQITVTLQAQDASGNFSTCEFQINLDCKEEIEVCGEGMIIPSGFSPNNDGMNDFFEIVGIEYCPNNKLKIHNRWGNTVYTADQYDNTWDGTNKTGKLKIGGEQLPSGTYFYILDLGEDPITGESQIKKGFIYITR